MKPNVKSKEELVKEWMRSEKELEVVRLGVRIAELRANIAQYKNDRAKAKLLSTVAEW